jgi:hypothetical protein
MTKPQRFLVRMVVFLAAVLVVPIVLLEPLTDALMANAPLNGLILGVLLLGIIYNIRQVLVLYPEVAWIETFRQQRPALSQHKPPKLLAPMATMLGERKNQLSLSAMSMRFLLDGIYSRLDESRDISRYTIGLLIFLGLLGTFWGLLDTVASIRDVIGSLSIGGDNVAQVFTTLKKGLETPLAGMGTAFSSSLFGLAGSLVLGFLDLQAGQAQNRFFNDLEEWLSSLTRLSSGALSGDADQSVPAYVQALLEQTAESLENLQRALTRGEENRVASNNNLITLGEKLGTLSDHMRTEQTVMAKLAENQTDIKNVMSAITEAAAKDKEPSAIEPAMDEATRAHIRNLDLYMARLLEEMSAGRDDIVMQIRSEIKLLARTIAASNGTPKA